MEIQNYMNELNEWKHHHANNYKEYILDFRHFLIIFVSTHYVRKYIQEQGSL